VPFTVVYDANVFFGNTHRDLHIRIALAGLVQAKWTSQILDEAMRSVAARYPDVTPEKVTRLRELINAAVPDCLVTGHEPLIQGLKLPDPDDRHVLAAAIKAGAQVIVTENLRDFPPGAMAEWNVEAKSPDDFVLDQISIDLKVVYACVQDIANSRRQRPETVGDVLTQMERAGLVQSAAALRSG
jgi:predicted nucleic acid-binding protein